MSRKLTLEIFQAVLATAVSTTKNSAQLIFSFESYQPLGLYYEKTCRPRNHPGCTCLWCSTTQDVIQSTSVVQIMHRHGN